VLMPDEADYLGMDDAALLAQCDVHTYKSSGPGGQHRNKVSSAVRIKHRPTGITAHGDDSRSQHENKRSAIRRLRMNIACRLRRPVGGDNVEVPAAVAECIFTPRGRPATGVKANGRVPPGLRLKRLEIGGKDVRFWRVAGYLLDLLEARQGRLAEVAAHLGISTSNFARVMKSDRHLFAAAQAIRKAHDQTPLS